MKKFLLSLLVILLVLIAIVLARTFLAKSKQVHIAQAAPLTVPDSVIAHLQEAISYKTVSGDANITDTVSFVAFHAFLQRAFPLIHKNCTKETISNYSLLYRWKGKNSAERPIVLMAHQDVVPIEEASLKLWKTDPFGGEVKDGFVWGRGAVDDKGSMMSLLEGVEQLFREGFQPSSDVYMAFGQDEEATGQKG